MKYGDVVKELRSQHGLTQKQVAEKVGVEQSTIGMIELNRRKPSVELAQKLANLFETTVDTILGQDSIQEDNLPKDVRILLRNVKDGRLTNEQAKIVNEIVKQFKETNNK